MNVTAVIINIIAIIGLLIAFSKDKDKTIKSLKIAGVSFIKILPMVFIIIIIIGLLLGFVPPGAIRNRWCASRRSSRCSHAHSCFVIIPFGSFPS